MVGRNGLGKTNFLEAIFVLCEGKPIRARKWVELIKKGESEAEIVALFKRGENTYSYSVRVDENGVDHRGYPFIKRTHALVNLPDDVTFIKGGPEERRRELDLSLSRIKPGYSCDLTDFLRVVRQRNEVLRGIKAGERTARELEHWNVMLVEIGERITRDRLQLLEEVRDKMGKTLMRLGRSTLRIRYYSTLRATRDAKPKDVLERMLAAEIRRGQTLVGPHRDEIIFEVDGRNTRRESSQGEQKLTTLAWKLAIEEMLRERGEEVILLLDDCLSELDDNHADLLLSTLEERNQVFVTDAVGRRQLYGYHVLNMEEYLRT